MKKANRGTCQLCNGEFDKAAIGRHLAKCPERPAEDGKERFLILQVQDRYSPEYWIYLEAKANTTLDMLDSFLRYIWLECCGHISHFEISGTTYSSSPDKSFGDKSMASKLSTLLSKGSTFLHEYDMGSTTTLKLKVTGERDGHSREKPVTLLARNIEPVITCSHCNEIAVSVCSECIYEDGGWLCESCSETHECGEEMQLPVVNSPRVGVCGYEG